LNLKGKTILVTGGAGFIGSHLSERLIEMDASVVGIDDLSAGKTSNISGLENEPRFDFVEGSVTDGPLIEKLAAKADVIFHTAALNFNASLADPFADLRINAGGTLNMLTQAARSDRTKLLVFSSTGSVYGELLYSPQDEAHPLNPVSPYGISKLAAEKYAMAWPEFAGQPTVCLRYFNVYGPRQRYDAEGGVIPLFLSLAMRNKTLTVHGTGDQKRCFTYVNDVVRATIQAAVNDAAWGDVYNIATNQTTSINELADQAIKSTNSSSKIKPGDRRPGDVDDFRPDISHADSKLEFTPTVTLSDGMTMTANWIKQQVNGSN
jgi:UDP-glucose 4-epimerase